MFAVFKTGGKQYRVAKDDVIRIEKLAGAAGDTVAFDQVLMVMGDAGPDIGAPLVDGATVVGEVVEQTRARKITVFKKKRRKNYRRTVGHRQHLTVVKITDILTGGTKPKRAARAEPEPAPAAPPAGEPEPAPVEPTPPQAAAEPVEERAPEAEVPAPAPAAGDQPMFTPPAGADDDLKKISGVGPVIEKKLKALGIASYAQIAALSTDDIARIDEVLNFRGRIERDNWTEQAAKLADEAG